MVQVDIQHKPLGEAEVLMLREVFPNIDEKFDLNSLAVAMLNHGYRQGEYVIDTTKLEDKNNWEDGQEANFLGSVIFANLNWLTRYYERKQAIENKQPLPVSEYFEFTEPSMIHTLDDDAFAQNHLTQLRRSDTDMDKFRAHAEKITEILISRAKADLTLRNQTITTPTMGGLMMEAPRLNERVVVVPILRAGLVMSAVASEMLPKSPQAMLGLRRDEHDPESKAELYYEKFPKIGTDDVVMITDPMLATGGSMCDAIRIVKENGGPKKIKVLALIASPEGIRRVQEEHPDVEIWVGAIDSHLNEKNYIWTGLGDAGDRAHGT